MASDSFQDRPKSPEMRVGRFDQPNSLLIKHTPIITNRYNVCAAVVIGD